MQVDLGGTDTQRLLAFNLKLTRNQGMLQVVNEDGRVLYMNQDMRKCLGVKDISVSVGGAVSDVQEELYV